MNTFAWNFKILGNKGETNCFRANEIDMKQSTKSLKQEEHEFPENWEP